MNPTDELWLDDKLGRRAEAEMLEDVLLMEARECSRNGREQAFVLALDAAYGEGKTFFLSRFERHLGLKHPVAFVDAWADDANDEPLLAIMSAINDALKPFLTPGSKATKWLKGATAAALPIIGKIAIGAGKTFLKKHIGDEIPDQIDTLMQEKSKAKPGIEEETIVGMIDEAAVNISSLADKMGAEMLAAYKIRKDSKETFKANMRALVSSISEDDGDKKQPLFIVIDELDRCRPDYAIKILEEVKHLFDIPGVVFIIAIHGDQLERSISAVYGAEFDAKSYLHRFFSRRYKLRRLTMKELIASRIEAHKLNSINWNYPSLVRQGGGSADRNLVELIDAFCSDYSITPRELESIVDGLRIFGRTWEHEVAIELVYLLGVLLRNVRALADGTVINPVASTTIHGGWGEDGRSATTTLNAIWQGYVGMKSVPLSELAKANYRISNGNLVVEALEAEQTKLYGNRVFPGVVSLINSYSERVARFGRLLEKTK